MYGMAVGDVGLDVYVKFYCSRSNKVNEIETFLYQTAKQVLYRPNRAVFLTAENWSRFLIEYLNIL